MTEQCIIPANPDISGIGMRIGIYITSYLVAAVPNLEHPHYGVNKLRGALLQAAGLNGFALVITAVIQTATGQLDLYHAIIIIHQLSFLGLTTIPAGTYKATLERMAVYYSTMWASAALFIGWWLYVWITAPTFGDQVSHCNSSTIYVIFFKDVLAVEPWLRWLFVAFGSLVAFSLLLTPIIVTLLFRGTGFKPGDLPTSNTRWERFARLQNILNKPNTPRPNEHVDDASTLPHAETIHISTPVDEEVNSPGAIALQMERELSERGQASFGSHVFNRGNGMWHNDDEDRRITTYEQRQSPVHVGREYVSKEVQYPEPRKAGDDDIMALANRGSRSMPFRILFVVYGTVMLELTVKRNHVDPGENVWSFGQIVAVVIAVGGINEVLHFFLGHEWKHYTAEDEQRDELETRSEKKKRRALEKERARQRKAAKAAEHVDLEANKHDVSTDTEPGMDDTFASGIGSVVMTPPEVPLATLPSKTPNAFDWLRANT